MSKFCFKCGATVDSEAEVCTNCGAPFGAPVIRPKSAPVAEAPSAASPPETPPETVPEVPMKLSKKRLTTVAIIAAAVLTFHLVAFGLLGCFTFFSSGYTEPIDIYFEAMYEGKTENVEKLAPKEYWNWRAEQTDMSRDQCIQDAQEGARLTSKSLKNQFGEDFFCTYEVAGKAEMSDEELRELAGVLERDYKISPRTVKKSYTVTIDLNFNGDEQKGWEITVVQIGYSWYWVEYYESPNGNVAYFPVSSGASIYGS